MLKMGKIDRLDINQTSMVRVFNRIQNTAIALLLAVLGSGFPAIAIAQEDGDAPPENLGVLDPFAPNPLLSPEPDPLLPNPPAPGTILGAGQRETLAPELDRLNVEANERLAAGDAIGAFELWTRELRLRRYFGVSEEIAALQRVGAIAWNNGQRLYLEFITERLQEILERERSQSQSEAVLEALGTAFKTVRAKEPAVETYQILLENADGRDDILQRERWAGEIARIYLNWLDYPKAAVAYEELLELQLQIQNLRNAGELPPPPPPPPGETETAPPSQIESLRELAFIYEQMGEFLPAIAARERLIGYYISQQNLSPVPEQKLAIAAHYEQLGKFQQAGQAYQEAYQVATTIQQFDNASLALEQLAKLYRDQNQIQTALELYQAQVLVNQQSYNFYGMMNAYDNIGEIYRQQKAYPQALQAFQSGLQLARELKYKEDYFSAKIDEVNREIYR